MVAQFTTKTTNSKNGYLLFITYVINALFNKQTLRKYLAFYGFTRKKTFYPLVYGPVKAACLKQLPV